MRTRQECDLHAGSARFAAVLLILFASAACANNEHPDANPTGPETQAASSRPNQGPRDERELEELVDSVITMEMEKQHVPGAAFVFVQNGRILLMKGYGVANLGTNQRVVPERTIWRIGSISKVFAADAVMQLAERGQVDLHADVNVYLRRFRVPEGFGRPVTLHHLLTHTAGFDEIRPGTQAPDEGSLLPLAEFLAPRLKRITAPGEVISYSTYGMTLAGAVVEEVSGQPFEQYLRENIWRPLRMEWTSVSVPSARHGDLAVGYEFRDGRHEPQPWEWYHTTPASSINSTASDMADWLLVHLEKGRSGDVVLLRPPTIQNMLRQHATGHPKVGGFAYGWNENLDVGYPRYLDHGGNMAGFSAEALIIPEHRAGFFLVHHGESANLRDPLKWAILERFYRDPTEQVTAPRPDPSTTADLSRIAGRYGWNTWCHTCEGREPGLVLDVRVTPDRMLEVNGRRWVAVEPALFVRDDGRARLAFRIDARGEATHMFAGGFWVFEKLP